MTTPKVEDTRSIVSEPFRLPTPLQESLKKYEPFTPILDRVLIRRVEDAPTTKMGVPDKYRQQTNKGEILGLGELVKSKLGIGDLVLFGEYNAERFQKDGEELWLVREANIRGVERLKVGQ